MAMEDGWTVIGMDMAEKQDVCSVDMRVHAQALGVRGMTEIDARRWLNGLVIEIDTKDLSKGHWRIIRAEPLPDDMWACLAVQVRSEDYDWAEPSN